MMSMHDHKQEELPLTGRDIVARALAQLDHILPAQAPIQDFVHHNTLHGFQHLPFEKALEEAEKLTGISAYLPEDKSREYYRQGRINEDDLYVAFSQMPALKHEEPVGKIDGKTLYRKDIYRIALLHELEPISLSQFNWQIEELAALDSIRPDVSDTVRRTLQEHNQEVTSGTNPVRRLWESICRELELRSESLHPENMLDLTLEQTEHWLDASNDTVSIHEQTQETARTAVRDFFGELGNSMTFRGFVLALSGQDVFDNIRPQLVRLCASALDEGVAAWQLPDCNQAGLYRAWRAIARYDAYPFLQELPDCPQIMAELPENAIDNIILQLEHLELPPAQWEGYLKKLALELPGWAGMINWRQQHPDYYTANHVIPDLADYLAIRLTLDRLWLNQVCRDIWKCEAKIGALERYFSKNLSEFVVRRHLYQGSLPEYLAQHAQALTIRAGSERQCRTDWQHLADLIHTWKASPMAGVATEITVNNAAWRLFKLSQHLGLDSTHIRQLGKPGLLAVLAVLQDFDLNQRRQIWLLAYERHYREALFHALRANHNRGRWAKREQSPAAQIVFCMDDREESFRRHLEELNPAIETLGAAGFFGVAMNYKGLDDTRVTPLCPIVVTPSHEVQEHPQTGEETTLASYRQRRHFVQSINRFIQHGFRQHLVLSQLAILILAPIVLLNLLAKSFLPQTQYRVFLSCKNQLIKIVKTRLSFTSTDNVTVATPVQPKLGFTETEQIDRIAGFLKNTGLTSGFAPLIILLGHGSMSQNNPHLAAYDCGACSGRHGGPNARLFAAMANRTEIRTGLSARGIHISPETWFIGAEHNTCNEEITWFDADAIPETQLAAFLSLKTQLNQAQHLSAHERCRRLASAPRNPELTEALAHIVERAADFSQARPELGHATNASAIVGRRSVSQGTFLDRRTFLISYDPTQDPDGKIVEGILLNVGPVGAGINLEYYFSTVNNDRLGCGTKVPHNIVGLFGVMEGATSDLRTGLPSQMIEIHEAMRLQLIVEAKTAILENIYARQPALKELIAGGWILLSAIDPDTGEIHVFERNTGFVPWQTTPQKLAIFAKSTDCYHDQTLPVSPALIKQPGWATG